RMGSSDSVPRRRENVPGLVLRSRRNLGNRRRHPLQEELKMRRREKGFTLIELLIVIIIIVLMATMAVALLSVFFRGQGARQGAMVVMQVLAQAKQEAAKTHHYHFVVFSKANTEGWMEIHRDMDQNGLYNGDDNPKTVDPDPCVED